VSVGRLLASLSLLALAAAACESESTVLSSGDIVSSIPWTAPEEARYRLMDGDEVKGSGVLRIEARDGKFSFTQEFENDEFRNEAVAVTDDETMQPQSVQYVIEGPEGTRRWQVQYGSGIADVLQHADDDERRDEIAVPAGSYDSWTDIFLWRTIDFREGFEATYSDVLSATLSKPQVISQTLKVTGQQTVNVPAGTFETWRLEIRSSDGKQKAWYADTKTRPLVRYDNGSLLFELVSLE
jgi:hypothetical protein